MKAANFRVELIERGASGGELAATPRRFAPEAYAGGGLLRPRFMVQVNQF